MAVFIDFPWLILDRIESPDRLLLRRAKEYGKNGILSEVDVWDDAAMATQCAAHRRIDGI